MITDIIRDAPFGQLLRYATGNRVLKYPEELDTFECPLAYKDPNGVLGHAHKHHQHNAGDAEPKHVPEPAPAHLELEKNASRTADEEKAGSTNSADSSEAGVLKRRPTEPDNAGEQIARVRSLPYNNERLELEQDLAQHATHANSMAVVPTKTADGTILCDWYTTDDPANPQNWSQLKKAWTILLVNTYTFIVYATSSIYVPSVLLIESRFGVGEFKASLGLALYVLGYGIGPLIFAPLSEVPQLGRNIPYITTFFLFTILTIPAALVDNLGGLVFLRFLMGFFGSPCLANGGATVGDLYSLLYMPYPLALWVAACFAGPAIGPMLSGFAVYAENWRWAQWEVLWMAGPCFLAFFFFLPETQPTTILLHRAARLRKASGNSNIRTQTEIDRRGTSFAAILWDSIIKPVEILVKDPAITFVSVYSALIYGIYYSFFESFPIVYGGIYHFNVGVTSVVFVAIVVGCFFGLAVHFSYLNWYLIPDIFKRGLRPQEHRLVPAIFASFGPVVGLFLFAWSARASVHWIVSVIGIVIYAASCFIIFQCVFIYIPMIYPQYAASLFAGNDFCRSLFAFGAVFFSRPMFLNEGIGKGVSILGGLSVMGIIGIFLIWHYGAKLRARSKFALGPDVPLM